MVEELGRITRPATANYQGKRKLLLAPLVHLAVPPESMPADGAEILARYWDQVDIQVRAVQNALGSVTHVYHENLPEGGSAGLGYLEATAQGSHKLTARPGGSRGSAGSHRIHGNPGGNPGPATLPDATVDEPRSRRPPPGVVRRGQPPSLRIRGRRH